MHFYLLCVVSPWIKISTLVAGVCEIYAILHSPCSNRPLIVQGVVFDGNGSKGLDFKCLEEGTSH